ncbi:MAG: hypothetical protein NVSMB33_14900 [Ktedonobacteraceae bacterium]
MGVLIFALKEPLPLVVVVPTKVESKLIVIVSLVPNPIPFTFIPIVEGPAYDESVIYVLEARIVDLDEISRTRLKEDRIRKESPMLTLVRDKKRMRKPHLQ